MVKILSLSIVVLAVPWRLLAGTIKREVWVIPKYERHPSSFSRGKEKEKDSEPMEIFKVEGVLSNIELHCCHS